MYLIFIYQGDLKNGVSLTPFLSCDVIASISHLKHPNIMGLRGYCMEQGQHILVHDYCTNGFVDKIFHSKSKCQGTLTWKARIMIVVCIVGALE
jgi:serine/threonine protein kinase